MQGKELRLCKLRQDGDQESSEFGLQDVSTGPLESALSLLTAPLQVQLRFRCFCWVLHRSNERKQLIQKIGAEKPSHCCGHVVIMTLELIYEKDVNVKVFPPPPPPPWAPEALECFKQNLMGHSGGSLGNQPSEMK